MKSFENGNFGGGGQRAEFLTQEESVEARRQRQAARQQRKIIACLTGLSGSSDPDSQFLNDPNVVITDAVRERFLDRACSDKDWKNKERWLLNEIVSPTRRTGFEGVQGWLENSENELKILCAAIDREGKIDNWQNMGVGDLRFFVSKYPTPMDFEETSAEFLEEFGPANRRAMDSFKRKVYGKQQEYWEQMKVLDGEAYNRRLEQGKRRKRFRGIGRRALNSAYAVVESVNSSEMEISHEWPPTESAVKRVSRAQVMSGMVNEANIEGGLWADQLCEDKELFRPDLKIFGVFDGAGGERGGKKASNTAASIVENLSQRFDFTSGAHLKWALEQANDAVVNDPVAGHSTAVLAKVVEHKDGRYLSYASVGDSRIYIVSRDGKVRQITKDEGEGNRIWNSLGTDENGIVKQYGDIKLGSGDRIMMCSDGITGDYGTDLMSNEEIANIMCSAKNPGEAAERLMVAARKKDDRTVCCFS
ncbi:protein serine/threonine phosphatase 2C family protein [Candidatus Saccharibacteria bacterium]|nr:protein serine/threonine phosphatase 2C family protein [Candidatus Saccharibacteria bacterium]